MKCLIEWSRGRDSNSQPRRWKRRTLPLSYLCIGGSTEIRTRGLLNAIQALSRTELSTRGAGDGPRTRDLDLGKVAFCHLNYSCVLGGLNEYSTGPVPAPWAFGELLSGRATRIRTSVLLVPGQAG